MSWLPCAEGAECTTVSVPVDHGVPDGPRREIAVRRLRAAGPSRGQLWYVDGGPGDSGTADLAKLAGVHRLVPDLDLVAFDPRGVGESGRLGCPTAEAKRSRDGAEITRKEWAMCLPVLRMTPDLPTYTTAQTAADLWDTLTTLREGTVVLWGVSYGTFLVNRLLVDHPAAADAVVLDGLAPPTWTFDRFDAGLDAQARRWLDEACAADPACAAHLGPDPVAFAERVHTGLEDRPCAGIDARMSRLIAGVLFQAGDLATHMPAALFRLDRCAAKDRRALARLVRTLGGTVTEKPSHSPVLQRQIAYTDLWAPSDADALRLALTTTVATTEVSANFAEQAEAWPVGPRDPARGVFAAPEMPVLLMHGGHDAAIPMEVAAEYAAAWPAAQWVPVPTAGHVTFNAGECPQSIFAAFVADPRKVDTTCVTMMPAPSFAAAPGDAELWGVGDRWGD